MLITVIQVVLYILAIALLIRGIWLFCAWCDAERQAKKCFISFLALSILGSMPFIIPLFRYCVEICFS